MKRIQIIKKKPKEDIIIYDPECSFCFESSCIHIDGYNLCPTHSCEVFKRCREIKNGQTANDYEKKDE